MDPGRDHDPQRSHAQSHNGGNRRQQHLLSPPASRATSVAGPSTPGPSTPLAEGSADDYFDRLSQAPSHLSRQSVQSLSRFPSLTSATSRPRLESTTSRPSIRIRRRSSVASNISSNVPPEAPVAAPAPTSSEGGYHGGRPRSISQPTSGARAVDAPPAARIRRMPAQAALPRLTEEGSRPTMAELGIPASPSPLSPLSPTASMPERAHSLEEAPEPAAARGNRLRRVSRLFMPGFSRRESQAGDVPATTEAEDEYHDQLVDYLDTIGNVALFLHPVPQLTPYQIPKSRCSRRLQMSKILYSFPILAAGSIAGRPIPSRPATCNISDQYLPKSRHHHHHPQRSHKSQKKCPKSRPRRWNPRLFSVPTLSPRA